MAQVSYPRVVLTTVRGQFCEPLLPIPHLLDFLIWLSVSCFGFFQYWQRLSWDATPIRSHAFICSQQDHVSSFGAQITNV